VNVLTGMDTIAACFLIPVGVAIHTPVSGLSGVVRSPFLSPADIQPYCQAFFSDYIHTVVTFSIIPRDVVLHICHERGAWVLAERGLQIAELSGWRRRGGIIYDDAVAEP
jgi:hypothetical protein